MGFGGCRWGGHVDLGVDCEAPEAELEATEGYGCGCGTCVVVHHKASLGRECSSYRLFLSLISFSLFSSRILLWVGSFWSFLFSSFTRGTHAGYHPGPFQESLSPCPPVHMPAYRPPLDSLPF